MVTAHANTPKVLLIVLDGFGIGKDYPFNAIQKANMPFYKSITDKYPVSQLLTSGEAVGLPTGVMGNSEVGHMNMGAGRIVYQELSRIDRDIRNGDFFRNKAILDAIAKVKASSSGARLHLFGLLSDAGVHAHINHLAAILKLTHEKQCPVTVHAFTDGRDTPPNSGVGYARQLADLLARYPHAVAGSVIGRYYVMDRDKRWDRVEKAWNVLIGRQQPFQVEEPDPNGAKALITAIERSYAAEKTDEFVEPVLLAPTQGHAPVRDGDGVFFYNFRADRARQITRAFMQPDFSDFNTGPRPKLCTYLCMTEYDKTFGLPVAYPPQNLDLMLPDILAANDLNQFRIAETEKYAHVTFFFNGSREAPYAHEERSLVPSPKDVATYDLKPEMSAAEVTDRLVARLEQGSDHFMLVNYANPDMIGHTGNFAAAVQALNFLDKCLERVVSAALKSGYSIMITADHGNVEEMRECGDHEQIHTQHTLNPVPVHFISNQFHYKLREGGVLADLAPSILQVMGIQQPVQMTGKSLLVGSR